MATSKKATAIKHLKIVERDPYLQPYEGTNIISIMADIFLQSWFVA